MTNALIAEQTAPKTGPRRTNAEKTADRREAVIASIPDSPAVLRARAEKQARSAELQAVQDQIASFDDQTPDAIRRAAARHLARLTNDEKIIEEPLVSVTVRARGAGKISMGIHIPDVGDVYFEPGETVNLPASIAAKYENLAWVDIDP